MTVILLTITGISLLFGYISEWRLHRFYKGIERDLNRFPTPKKRLTKQLKIKFDTACSFRSPDADSKEYTETLIRTGMNHYRLMGFSLFQAEHLWAWFAGVCMLPGIGAWFFITFLPNYTSGLGLNWERPLTMGIISVLFLALCDRFYDNAGCRIRLETLLLDKLMENSPDAFRRQEQKEQKPDSFSAEPEDNSPAYSAALTRENETARTSAQNRSTRSGTKKTPAKNTAKRAPDPNEHLVAEMMDYFTKD